MYKALTKCPICSGDLVIKRLQCNKCGTVIENNFYFSKFGNLSEEQIKFIEIFLQCRGNIKDVEKTMGISYPTVRAKLDNVIEALGLVGSKEGNEIQRDEEKMKILEKLDNGEITYKEAMELINKNKRGI